MLTFPTLAILGLGPAELGVVFVAGLAIFGRHLPRLCHGAVRRIRAFDESLAELPPALFIVLSAAVVASTWIAARLLGASFAC